MIDLWIILKHDVMMWFSFLRGLTYFTHKMPWATFFFFIHSFTIPIVFGELNEQIYFISVRCFSFFPSGS
jgi:hypothetical protein